MSDLLTTREAAALVRLSPARLRAKLRAGELQHGVHAFRPPHSQLRWSRSALEHWARSYHAAWAGEVTLARAVPWYKAS